MKKSLILFRAKGAPTIFYHSHRIFKGEPQPTQSNKETNSYSGAIQPSFLHRLKLGDFFSDFFSKARNDLEGQVPQLPRYLIAAILGFIGNALWEEFKKRKNRQEELISHIIADIYKKDQRDGKLLSKCYEKIENYQARYHFASLRVSSFWNVS